MSNNRTCKVCGTKYKYCPTCGSDAFKPAWMSMFCSRNCYDTFITLSNLTNGKITEEMAKKEIIKFDTSKVTNDTMIKQINELLKVSEKEESVVEEVKVSEEIKEDSKEAEIENSAEVESQDSTVENQNTNNEEGSVLVVSETAVKDSEPKTEKKYYGKRKK